MGLFLIKPRKCPKCGKHAVFFGYINEGWDGDKCLTCGWNEKQLDIRKETMKFKKWFDLLK